MKNLNIEIKAKCSNINRIREILLSRNAREKGTDHQVDTYFKCNIGRLKLREGNIEHSLVSYIREDKTGPKKSDVIYFHPQKNTPLKDILTTSLGELITVTKTREIFYIENIKFHLDMIEELGTFVEIEAIDTSGDIGELKLRDQCNKYLALFGIKKKDLIDRSYSDLLLDRLENK